MIRSDDRLIVIDVAVEIFCARIQANSGKHGYSPDMNMCVGEAAALVNKVTLHMAPKDRPDSMRVRGKRETVELEFRSGD